MNLNKVCSIYFIVILVFLELIFIMIGITCFLMFHRLQMCGYTWAVSRNQPEVAFYEMPHFGLLSGKIRYWSLLIFLHVKKWSKILESNMAIDLCKFWDYGQTSQFFWSRSCKNIFIVRRIYKGSSRHFWQCKPNSNPSGDWAKIVIK